MNLPVCCALAALLTATPLGAQVYKWTDANGVAQYSSTRPPGVANVTRLDSTSTSVSTYASGRSTGAVWQTTPGMQAPPNLKPGDLPAGVAPGALLPPGYLPPQSAVPVPGYQPGSVDESQLALWKAHCERERYTDCNDRQALINRYQGGMGVPPVVVVLGGGLRPGALATTGPQALNQPQPLLRPPSARPVPISRPSPAEVPASALSSTLRR